ncbi:MAG: FAD-binding protein, partial [Deltaproteobacteria bacterium]|nr:FAD-binding protein [Deltaproteobacteria bacterium]
PELYVACGISGSIQHLAGMAQARYVVSINTDRKAPMVSASNVAFIGDLFQIVPMLTEKIRNYKEKNRQR